MTQLILTVHTGIHDGAALFDDYTLLAAAQLERLTRRKNDGSEYPDRCIEEVLSIAGATRKDIDVLRRQAVRISGDLLPQYSRGSLGQRAISQTYQKKNASVYDKRISSLQHGAR